MSREAPLAPLQPSSMDKTHSPPMMCRSWRGGPLDPPDVCTVHGCDPPPPPNVWTPTVLGRRPPLGPPTPPRYTEGPNVWTGKMSTHQRTMCGRARIRPHIKGQCVDREDVRHADLHTHIKGQCVDREDVPQPTPLNVWTGKTCPSLPPHAPPTTEQVHRTKDNATTWEGGGRRGTTRGGGGRAGGGER